MGVLISRVKLGRTVYGCLSTTEEVDVEGRHYAHHHEKHALIKISARSVLGSSVIRVFNSGSKVPLLINLEAIPINGLLHIKDEVAYGNWFEKHLSKLANEIQKTNSDNPNIYPGYKWGHASKILNLFIREMVEYKRYFGEQEATKIRKWLYVPIDSQVINKIKEYHPLPFNKIKDIDTAEKFYGVQDLLGKAAQVLF